MFRADVLIVRRSKLYSTASGIINKGVFVYYTGRLTQLCYLIY